MKKSPRRSGKTKPSLRIIEAMIETIGAQGDGVAHIEGEIFFIPLTVPGDKVMARIEGKRGDGMVARAVQIVSAGPERVQPPCPYFGECGGCALQHWDASAYRQWKQNVLVESLVRVGFSADKIGPMIEIAPGTRRRATFAMSKRGSAVQVGFNAKASHKLVEIDRCLLLAPELTALLPSLRQLLKEVGENGEGDIEATLSESGIDLVIAGDARLDLFDRERLASFAEAMDIARLSWRQHGAIEPIAMRRAPIATFAGRKVALPYGSFLQPSKEGEQALARLVFDAVGDSRRIADLFCGSGTFSFVLAQKADVLALENDVAAIGALNAASRAADSRVIAKERDLLRNPIAGPPLKEFDAVVFDPPRAGAMAQSQALAELGPPIVVAVSCNPATLARDARILAEGGYRLEWAIPVDQFPWSAHLETVALFKR